MGDVARWSCGCPAIKLEDVHGLVEPSSEVLFELDQHGRVTGGFPHVSSLISGVLCCGGELTDLLPTDVARLIADRAEVVRDVGVPTTVEIGASQLRARIAPRGSGVLVLLRGVAPTVAPVAPNEETFRQLFEAAPLPLALDLALNPTAQGSSRFNRRFTEMFGYTAEDIPTVQHWWPRAYPDPVYRATIRDEWFRRLHLADVEHPSITPIEATVTCKDGSQRAIEFFAASVGEHLLVVFVERTEHKPGADPSALTATPPGKQHTTGVRLELPSLRSIAVAFAFAPAPRWAARRWPLPSQSGHVLDGKRSDSANLDAMERRVLAGRDGRFPRQVGSAPAVRGVPVVERARSIVARAGRRPAPPPHGGPSRATGQLGARSAVWSFMGPGGWSRAPSSSAGPELLSAGLAEQVASESERRRAPRPK